MRYTVKSEDEEIVFESDNPRKVIAFLKRYLSSSERARNYIEYAIVHDSKTGVTLTVDRSSGELSIERRVHDFIADDIPYPLKPGSRLFDIAYERQAQRMNTTQRTLERAATSLGTVLNTAEVPESQEEFEESTPYLRRDLESEEE